MTEYIINTLVFLFFFDVDNKQAVRAKIGHNIAVGY